MNAKEAVAARILALCDERGIAINALCQQFRGGPLHRLQHAQRQESESRRGFSAKALRWAGNFPQRIL